MLKKLMLILDHKQKCKMIWILFLMLVGALLECFSIGAVVPVVKVLLDEDSIHKEGIVKSLYDFLGCTGSKQFAIVMLIVLVAAFIAKNLFLLYQNIVQFRFVYTNQFRTSERMMIQYMKKPYEYYLNAETAVIQRSITSDVNNMYALILALLQLTSEFFVGASLLAITFKFDPLLTILMAVLLAVTILIIKGILKPIMEDAGNKNQYYYSGLFKWIQQSVSGFKEIKIGNREMYFIDSYKECGAGYVNAVQKYNIFNSTPRLLIETVCIIAVILYILVRILNGSDMTELLPVLTAFGVAAVRLLPCANRMNTYLTSISYLKPFLMGVSDSLKDEISNENSVTDELLPSKEKLQIKDKIQLRNITYAYPNTQVNVLDQASMEIPIGSAVGIVGTSGSGKSTIVDVLLGLLPMKNGEVTADGADIFSDGNYHKWLKNVGYIPQTIFMLDDTIKKNVAFGIPDDEVDERRLWEVLKEAQIDEFIKELPEGLETGIGERGIRISGGQRQRIGIARALYDNPEVLILDEATSALDNETESAIMESINRLHGKKTLIIIAHRLQTIEKCDMIYRIENGKAIKQ